MLLALNEFLGRLSGQELIAWNERFKWTFLISTPVWASIITWLVISMATQSTNQMHDPTFWVPSVFVDGHV